mgnify:CR=1 FL=1
MKKIKRDDEVIVTTGKDKDKRGKVSNCDPHSWHLPVYVLNRPAHDKDMEQQYMSSL